MIWESVYWKKPLLQLANKLTKWQAPQKWGHRDLVGLEKDLFIAFYSIRKLMDAKKLSGSTAEMMVNVSVYPNKGRDVTFLNWHRLQELYDFTSARTEHLPLRFVCNQVIHSYVFMPCITEAGVFEGIFFCSDYERHKNLYGLDRTELIKVFHMVGNDYPNSRTFIFMPNRRDYDVSD